jgi:hypothetical protein
MSLGKKCNMGKKSMAVRLPIVADSDRWWTLLFWLSGMVRS